MYLKPKDMAERLHLPAYKVSSHPDLNVVHSAGLNYANVYNLY